MNRTEKFIKNSITTALLQVVTMLSGFIVPKIILSNYGSDINGLVTSITQFISYFNLVEAGIAGAAIYSLYKPLAKNDYKTINKIVSTAKSFYTKSGYIFVALVLGLSCIYPFFVQSGSLQLLDIILLVMILGVSGALEFFTMSKYRVLLTADQKVYVVSYASIAAIILNTIIIYILGSLKLNIVIVRAVALTAVFLRSLILHLYVKRNYKQVKYNSKIDNQYLDKRWDVLYLQILGVVQTGIPIILLTIIEKLKTVSIYAVYNLVINGINSILSIFINNLSASFGDIIARKEEKTLQNSYQQFEYIHYNLVSLCYSISFILILPFVLLFTTGITDANYNLPVTGALFVLNGLFYNLKTPQGMLVISAGLYKETRWRSTIQGLTIIVLGIPFTMMWGINGVLIASIISNLYRCIDLYWFIPKNITKLPVRNTLFRVAKTIIVMTIIIIPSFIIKLSIHTYIDWIKCAILIGIYALIVIIIVDLIVDRKNLKAILQRMKLMRGKK